MSGDRLVLVHGLVADRRAGPRRDPQEARARRAAAVAAHGDALGVRAHTLHDGRRRVVANLVTRTARGTARAPDAVEVTEFDEAAVRAALADPSGRARLEAMAGCEAAGFDPARSFVLAGAPRRLVEGTGDGQRVLWFGYGSGHRGQAEFIEHYTHHHGTLVARHAHLLGLRSYLQVPQEQPGLCASLHALGLGVAPAPPVFAALVIGRTPLDPARWGARRSAVREIRADERQHIDFRRSMLLLA